MFITRHDVIGGVKVTGGVASTLVVLAKMNVTDSGDGGVSGSDLCTGVRSYDSGNITHLDIHVCRNIRILY